MSPGCLIGKGATRWRAPLAAVLLVSVVTGACTEFVDGPLPDGAIPLTAPTQYRLWWDATTACSGITRPFDSVGWYVVPGAYMFPTPTGEADGQYQQARNRIVLAEQSVGDGMVVRHEMLHALLRGTDGHPAPYFQHRCGGFVACDGSCAREPDPLAVTGSVTAAVPSDLELGLRYLPASGLLGPTGGWYMVVVSARNPLAQPVRVTFPLYGSLSPTFGYSDQCEQKTHYATAASITFAAGETRYQTFDMQWCRAGSGSITGRGSLGRDSTAVRTLPVQP